ncbi:polyketide antibiotic transporter [Mycobacterium sp. ACS1612]|uniref:ABC transporter permease n=1 Tax=Mycobacterium sp. ACS1612 TaxID=1834117 RepID=UPI0007FD2D42|nr:polyketide antibiotic transporter [Mycobacterium sp. ACS1612]OBF37691.1 polyketide antibiotic transporter [Mycobacterium sp. ACS1612]
MTAALSTVPAVARTTTGRAINRLVIRQIRRGAAIVAVVCAAMSATVAVQYQTTFRGSLDESGLRALVDNPAIRILFGTPVALDDVGGFTVWRTATPILVLACVWILLAAIRITRGEEDAGRSDLLLAGPIRTVDLVTHYLTTIAAAALLIGAAVGISLLAAGTDAAGSVIYASAVLGVTLTFGTAGVFAAQLMPTRSAAVGVTVSLLGAALLLRMLADSTTQFAWAAWASPFGLTARAAPYADNRLAPLFTLAGFSIAFAAAALAAAGRRDVGSGLVTVTTRRAPRTRLLGSVGGFAVRRAIRLTVGWAAGITAYFLLRGTLIASILEFFEKNPRFAELAAAAGFGGLDSAKGFSAALFGLLAIPTGLYGAVRLSAMITDERARRWTPLFASPVSRTRLMRTEITMTTAGVLVLHAIAGLMMATGAAVTGAPLSFGDALAGALNSAPIAWLSVGAAALAAGWFPSAVLATGVLPVTGGFLLDVVTQSVRAPAWVVDASPFAHLSPVPVTAPDWTATAALLTIGALLAAVGLVGYLRRDLTS